MGGLTEAALNDGLRSEEQGYSDYHSVLVQGHILFRFHTQSSSLSTMGEGTDTIVLITGANQGIGYEVARQIGTEFPHCCVLLGSRDSQKGEDGATKLRRNGILVQAITLDVTDDASSKYICTGEKQNSWSCPTKFAYMANRIQVKSAVEAVTANYDHLDVLINNAGISNDAQLASSEVSARTVYMEQFNTNVFGAVQTTEAFLPLLERSKAARLVFTSSGMGSLTQRCDEMDKYYSSMLPIYRSSKAALNMICLHYAAKYKERGWKVNAVDPGHVATNLNRFKGPDPVESGAVQLVRMAMLGEEGPSGTFSNCKGVVPW